MAGDNNYLFFDGSALIAQVRDLWRTKPELKSRKLKPLSLVDFLVSGRGSVSLIDFTERRPQSDNFRKGLPYKRALFYFAKGDSQVEKYVEIPAIAEPGLVRDVNFRYCGKKLPRSAEFDAWVAQVPNEFRERISKTEKGVDIQVCCDALQLAAAGHVDRLFLLTNDSDFVPLCDSLKSYGANISLLRLPGRPVNLDLAASCDGYYEVPETALGSFFAPISPGPVA